MESIFIIIGKDELAPNSKKQSDKLYRENEIQTQNLWKHANLQRFIDLTVDRGGVAQTNFKRSSQIT